MNRNHGKGLLFAALGFGLLSVGDAIVKSTAGVWPGPAIAGLRYFFSTIGLGALVAMTGGRAAFSVPSPWVQFARGASVAFSAACFFAAVFLMPLAEATTITFVNPVLTALLSALILREPAPRAAWLATAAAFAGVVIVLRPNLAVIGPAALLPLGSALGMALLIVFNRMAAGAGSAIKMQFLTSLMATPVLIIVTLAGHASGLPNFALSWPGPVTIAICAIVAVSASAAHIYLYQATTLAPASLIAPMTYVQLLLSMTFGIVFFDEWPDLVALAGAALVVGAGLYLWRARTRSG